VPEQALYLKWRPTAFDEVVGQEHITRTLRNSLKTGRIRHAYLFSGPRGTGKTTNARLLAKAVNCTHPDPDMRPCNACACCVAVNEGRFLDLIEIDAASHTGVDDVRDLRDKIAFAPSEGRYKVYIIDEVHRFSGNAFDALLKTLEEPPPHALFVLATTEIDKVPATIKSRCLPFEFRRLSLQEVADRLELICANEGIKAERGALELIAREGTGSVRDSISLLDQVVADPHEVITLELAQRILGTASVRAVREMVDALVEKSVARGLHIINEAVDSGSDPRQFGQQVVEQLRAVLLAQTSSVDLLHASEEEKAHFQALAGRISRSELLRAIRAFNEAVTQYHSGWQPQLTLELAFIESLQEPEVAQMVAYAPTMPAFGAPAPTASAPAPVGEPSALQQQLQQKWAEVQRMIFQNIPKAKPEHQPIVRGLPNLLGQVVVRAVEGQTVVLGAKQIFIEKLNDPTRKEWVERAILRVTGQSLRVRYVLDEGGTTAAMQYMTPSPDAPLHPIEQDILNHGGAFLGEEAGE
jgi:DNA polymerase-3 subunit gamma/tau